jgi:hypothetical protein
VILSVSYRCHTLRQVTEHVDWKVLADAADHMFGRHQVTPEQADEAINDVDAIWFDPDPKSRSGRGVRVIGYSHTARAVLTIILLHADMQLGHTGWCGVNGWRSNSTERRTYREGVEDS